MNRRSAVRMLAAGGAGCLCPAFLRGNPPQDLQRDYTLRSDAVLVLIDVSVKDSQGRVVPNLVKDNFSVSENGRPQRITVFDAQDRPVTVGILVDGSKSMTPIRPAVLTAAEALIEESNRQDEMFILHFSESVIHGLPSKLPLSGNLTQLRAALSLKIPSGRTALYDALATGVRHLNRGRRDRKTLVLLSDGGDTISLHSRRETLEIIQRSVATIYTIGLFGAGASERNPAFLRHLAKMSGGEAYFPSTTHELVPLCKGIAREIRSRYTIGYTPQYLPQAKPVRQIEVRVGGAGLGRLRVRSRRTYRYDETENAKWPARED